MRTPAARRPNEPARCAGLRQALMHGWTRGFPLRESPFQVLANRLGGTLREVLGHCQVLSDTGALDAIRVHWSPALERVHWRCAMVSAGRPQRRLLAELGGLPGVTRVDWIEHDGRPDALCEPTLWFDLVARDAASATAQRARFEARHGPLLCLPVDAPPAPPGAAPATRSTDPGRPHRPHPCACRAVGGPCTDPELARLCEAGLPLRAHPFRSLSDAAHRSERDVLCTLRRWQRAGLLEDLGMEAPAGLHESLWTVVAVAGDPQAPTEGTAGSPAALLARPGVGEALGLPGHPHWPWRLQVGAVGASSQTEGLLLRALGACGLDGRERRVMRVHRVKLRAAPLLFAQAGAAAA